MENNGQIINIMEAEGVHPGEIQRYTEIGKLALVFWFIFLFLISKLA